MTHLPDDLAPTPLGQPCQVVPKHAEPMVLLVGSLHDPPDSWSPPSRGLHDCGHPAKAPGVTPLAEPPASARTVERLLHFHELSLFSQGLPSEAGRRRTESECGGIHTRCYVLQPGSLCLWTSMRKGLGSAKESNDAQGQNC